MYNIYLSVDQALQCWAELDKVIPTLRPILSREADLNKQMTDSIWFYLSIRCPLTGGAACNVANTWAACAVAIMSWYARDTDLLAGCLE